MADYIIGIDIGGTTVKIGIIHNHGDILTKWEIPTNTTNAGKSIIDDIWHSLDQRLTEEAIDRSTILGIGVGAPGFIDVDTGFVFEAVNIGWKNVDLTDQLKAKSGLPVFLENDANVAVLGENWKGAGNQAKNVIAITLGTGVGGGIIANGSVVDGENGMAGEIGHMTIDPDGWPCNCGRRGCLETIVSATGIVRQAKQVITGNPTSKLAAFVQEYGEITTKDIFQLAGEGDTLSESIIQHTADILGMFIANMAVTLNPSKVLIGGGVSKAGGQLLKEIIAAFDRYALPRAAAVCDIRVAQLGNDAGMIGSAFLVKQKELNVKF
ncbi:glucokinase [Virgibacillus halotolerans]|uniref:ROK family glucokinase n=1 Tax=Virgibacillus halotolerans TaxID=1071053 RepID=UPI001961A751|nr:ROK family glucokinase [Virgibacillus halotolerans]MBM7597966.1 glucokinase [Virgibacillus halotolerans]